MGPWSKENESAAAEGPQLGQCVEEYLAWALLQRDRSQRTVAEYSHNLARFQSFAGDIRVDEVDRDLIVEYGRHVATQSRQDRPGRRLSARRRYALLVALRNFLRFAAREGWVEGGLFLSIDLPQLPERLPKPLPDETLDKLFASFTSSPTNLRDRALFSFLLSTGARISEALQLDRQNLDLDHVWVIGKGDKERKVLLTERTKVAMREYLAVRQDPSPALFISFQPARLHKAGNRLSSRGAREICDRVAEAVGISHFSPHWFRHTLGTKLQESTGDARLTAEVLGHQGLQSVTGYTKVSERKIRLAYRDLEKEGI